VFHERFQVQGSLEAFTEATNEHRRSNPRYRHTIAGLRVRALKEYRESFRVKDGKTVNIRFVEQNDREVLKNYVRSMSERCRYNRFLSASSELPEAELDRFTCLGDDDRFTLVATTAIGDLEAIVGEASYVVHSNVLSVECSLSVSDRWQELGIGMALLKSVEYRAASVGAERIFGDVLPSNKFMIRLARKRGYAAVTSPVDLRLVRCEKTIRAPHHDGSP
jgi:GNAT superfamily N-acetyltransferase